MDKDCLFCKIINGIVKSDIIYNDEQVAAFKDINPQAPVHILIIPKQHIEKVSDLNEGNKLLVSNLVLIANRLARD
ncbi:MAG: HIT domain-containing protein, partial [Candidatus Omnitrophota bacterium]|nr:HIT domain-containing protein [Candidatus Omnitrophota bacterium]